MIDELNRALAIYNEKWQAEKAKRTDTDFFAHLKPTAVGWKTVDVADFDTRFAELRGLADQIHMGWMNERWIAVIHLRDTELFSGISVVKLMQRRPSSSDASGLDHVDFYSPAVKQADAVLEKEPSLKWSHEENGPCKWISLWYAGTEAKLRFDTTVDVSIKELQEMRDKVLGKA